MAMLMKLCPALSVTITLADEIDLSRGDILTKGPDNIIPSNHFASHVIWMAEQKLIKGRPIIVKFCADETSGQVTEIKHLIHHQRLFAGHSHVLK